MLHLHLQSWTKKNGAVVLEIMKFTIVTLLSLTKHTPKQSLKIWHVHGHDLALFTVCLSGQSLNWAVWQSVRFVTAKLVVEDSILSFPMTAIHVSSSKQWPKEWKFMSGWSKYTVTTFPPRSSGRSSPPWSQHTPFSQWAPSPSNTRQWSKFQTIAKLCNKTKQAEQSIFSNNTDEGQQQKQKGAAGKEKWAYKQVH